MATVGREEPFWPERAITGFLLPDSAFAWAGGPLALRPALAAAKLERVGSVVAPIDEEIVFVIGSGHERLELGDHRVVGRAHGPLAEGLAFRSVLLIELEQRMESRGNALGWKWHDLPRELHAVGGNLPAQHELVLGRLLLAHPAGVSVEPNVSDVVLATGIRAAADLDAGPQDFGVGLLCEFLSEHLGERQRSRDAQVAGRRSRAAGDIGDSARPGGREVERVEVFVDLLQAVERRPRNDEVLRNRDAHGAEAVLVEQLG